MMITRRTRPSACIVRAATTLSLKTQNPSPWSRPAWCVPPARLTPMPSASAARLAPIVPPTDRRDRSTNLVDQGKPIRRISCAVSVPCFTFSTYTRSCAWKSCSSLAGSGISRFAGETRLLVTTHFRSMAYFSIGKRCPEGRGKTKWSQ
jgi:hypothetical protein